MSTSNTTTVSIREFFSVFERASASLDLAVLGGLFAEQFLSLSPTSCQLVGRRQFLAALPARKKVFERIGATGTTLADLTERTIDEQHSWVETLWVVTYPPGSDPEARLTLASGFLLRRQRSEWQIVVYLNHGDVIAAEVRKRAGLGGVDPLDNHPDNPQAYNMRGTVYGEAGRDDQALADFNKAISLDPNYAQAYANRALIYRKTNRLDLALADDDKALTIDADYAPAYVGRGIVYRGQGHANEALADFNKAIALKPDNADAYYNRGLLYQSRQQHQFAIDDFSAAIGLENGNAEPWTARALSYLAIGDNKSAATDLDEAVQLDPQNARAWSSRGLAYERLGQKDKAAGSYAKALNINDKYQPATEGFARVGGKIGQTYPTF